MKQACVTFGSDETVVNVHKEADLPNSLSTDQLRQLAQHGAAARIQELEAEIAAIRGAFPGSGAARRAGRRRRKRGRPAGVARTGGAGRKRRRMSPAARKAVSERMTKYWAARRARKGMNKK